MFEQALPTAAPPPLSQSLHFVDAGAIVAGATKFTAAWAGDAEVFPYTFFVLARAGTLRNLRVRITSAPGAGQNFTYTVRVNGVDTGIVVIIADAATSGSDLVNSAAIVAGDRVTLKEIASAGAAVAGVNMSAGLELAA